MYLAEIFFTLQKVEFFVFRSVRANFPIYFLDKILPERKFFKYLQDNYFQ